MKDTNESSVRSYGGYGTVVDKYETYIQIVHATSVLKSLIRRNVTQILMHFTHS